MEGFFASFDKSGIDSTSNNNFSGKITNQVIENTFSITTFKEGEITKSNLFSDARYYVTSNSRIDNKSELLKKYDLSKEISNEELIIYLYKKYKEEAFNKLNGGFSILIFDKFTRNIIAVTDHLSIKPLYLSIEGSNIKLASSIDNLFQGGVKKNLIDKKIVFDLLACGAPRAGRTIYKNIDIVENNHFVLIEDSGFVKKEKYFSFKCLDRESFKQKNYYKKNVKNIFLKVLENQLQQTNKKIALSLSGGLDSSSIVCGMDFINKKKSLNKNLSTYSAVFSNLSKKQEKLSDEKKYMKSVIDQVDVTSNYYNFKDKGSLSILEDITDLSEPAMGPNLYIYYAFLEKAKKENISSYFEGIGGDSTISHGFGRFFELGRKGDIFNLHKEYKEYCKLKKKNYSFFACLKRFVIYPNLPISLIKHRYNRMKDRLDVSNLNLFLKSEHAINVSKQYELIHGHHPQAIISRRYPMSYYSEISAEDPLTAYDCRLINMMGKKYDIEMFAPFLDKRLMNFCIQVPLSEKLKKGRDRFYFRKAMQNIIPKEVLNRPNKSDISPLFFNELIKFPLEEVMKILFHKNSFLIDFFDKKKIIEFHKQMIEKKCLNRAFIFYRLIYMSKWLSKRSHAN